MNPAPFEITVLDGIESMQKDEWGQLTTPDFPFNEHDFLSALETSGTLGAERGWVPQYLVLRKSGQLEAASCLYNKTNSYGEYIFDWAWADAFHRHGIPYYPKMVGSSPFTPATGPKIMVRNPAEKSEYAAALINAGIDLTRDNHCSSLHYLFISEQELPYFEAIGFTIRHSFQYHWHNRSYQDFASFLAALKPKKRKQIQRERNHLQSAGLTFSTFSGRSLLPEHAEFFYQLYLNTIRKMQAIPYLNLEFFQQVFAKMRDNIVFMTAEEQGTPIAGALYFTKGQHLYGRYWGALQDVRNLHFELCYYQPIEWCIAHRLTLFEAGAQGEHKIARGFIPKLTFSAHLILHPGFSDAITGFIEDERRSVAQYFAELAAHNPYLTDNIV